MRALHAKRYRAFVGLLREAREGAGLTQAEVAKALGRPQSFVSKSESGERRVDVIELADLARLYGKPLSHFVPDSANSKSRR
jgi:transcriptional regulator with XRE-family HTH domain